MRLGPKALDLSYLVRTKYLFLPYSQAQSSEIRFLNWASPVTTPQLGSRGSKTISSCQVTMWSPARLGLKRRQGYQAGFQRSRAVRNVYTGNVWSKLRRSVVVFPSHFELGFFASWIGRSEMEFATLVLLLRNKPRNGQSRHISYFARWSSHSWSLGRLWSWVSLCAL